MFSVIQQCEVLKITQISKLTTVELVEKYLQAFSPSLQFVNSSHLVYGDSSFKFAFVNFSSIEDAEVAVKAINGTGLFGHENNLQTKEQLSMQLTQTFFHYLKAISIKGDEALKIAYLSLKRHTLTLNHLSSSKQR